MARGTRIEIAQAPMDCHNCQSIGASVSSVLSLCSGLYRTVNCRLVASVILCAMRQGPDFVADGR